MVSAWSVSKVIHYRDRSTLVEFTIDISAGLADHFRSRNFPEIEIQNILFEASLDNVSSKSLSLLRFLQGI